MSKKEDLRILKTKASLFRSFLELLEEKSFDEIKISEICALSSINRSTFYDRFQDKQELLQAYVSSMREDFTESILISVKIDSMKGYFLELLNNLLNYLHKNKKVYTYIFQITSNSTAIDMMREVLVQVTLEELEKRYGEDVSKKYESYVLFQVSGSLQVIRDSFLRDSFSKKDCMKKILPLLDD